MKKKLVLMIIFAFLVGTNATQEIRGGDEEKFMVVNNTKKQIRVGLYRTELNKSRFKSLVIVFKRNKLIPIEPKKSSTFTIPPRTDLFKGKIATDLGIIFQYKKTSWTGKPYWGKAYYAVVKRAPFGMRISEGYVIEIEERGKYKLSNLLGFLQQEKPIFTLLRKAKANYKKTISEARVELSNMIKEYIIESGKYELKRRLPNE